MADRQLAGHALQDVLIEHLADQTHVLVQPHLGAIEDRHARRFLAAVLESVKTEISEVGDRLPRSQNCEHTASFFWLVGAISWDLNQWGLNHGKSHGEDGLARGRPPPDCVHPDASTQGRVWRKPPDSNRGRQIAKGIRPEATGNTPLKTVPQGVQGQP